MQIKGWNEQHPGSHISNVCPSSLPKVTSSQTSPIIDQFVFLTWLEQGLLHYPVANSSYIVTEQIFAYTICVHWWFNKGCRRGGGARTATEHRPGYPPRNICQWSLVCRLQWTWDFIISLWKGSLTKLELLCFFCLCSIAKYHLQKKKNFFLKESVSLWLSSRYLPILEEN